jgi:hypothetical protein
MLGAGCRHRIRRGHHRRCRQGNDHPPISHPLQIRHHAGTTNATRIENWVRFLIGFATTATPENATNIEFNEMFNNNNIAQFYRRRRAALAA